MREDITDEELSEILRKKREEIKAYNQKHQQKNHIDKTVGSTLADIPKRHEKREKKIQKHKGKNKRELPDNRYIIIPNEFIEAIYKQYLRPNESKVLWFLIRKTWGWQKRADFISLRQFSKELDISKDIACRALSRLKRRRIVDQLGNKTYAIQTDISLWHDEPKKSRRKGD